MEFRKKLPTLYQFINDSINFNDFADGLIEIATTYASREVYTYMINYVKSKYINMTKALSEDMIYYIKNEDIRKELFQEITGELISNYKTQ